MLYAVLATSTHRARPCHFLDVAAAKAHPGVVEVITPANRPALAQDPDEKTNPFMFRLDLLQNDRVRYANQPIAVVIAETLEAATEGAALLAPRYEVEPAARRARCEPKASCRRRVGVGSPAQVQRGDVEAGLAAATQRIDATYETAAAVSQRDGAACDRRRMGRRHGSRSTRRARGSRMAQARLAGLFGISPENIHIRSPFLGGGFGSKGFIVRTADPRHHGGAHGRPAGEARAARASRCTARSATARRRARRLRLGTDGDGALTALDHHTKTASSTLRRFLRAGRRRLAHALCQPRHRHHA